MKELEKLRVLLPHWIEHNEEHANEFREWAKQAGEAGADIVKASKQLEAANDFLRMALEKLEGPEGVPGSGDEATVIDPHFAEHRGTGVQFAGWRAGMAVWERTRSLPRQSTIEYEECERCHLGSDLDDCYSRPDRRVVHSVFA